MGLFDKLFSSLHKTRENIGNKIDKILASFGKIDEELFEELEEALICSDMGVDLSTYIIEKVKNRVKQEKITDSLKVRTLLKEEISKLLSSNSEDMTINSTPLVILVVGVNGVGKTTTIVKIANMLKNKNNKVIIAAGDTFRAAAIEQLEVWANKINVNVIKHSAGSDPAAVVYDAIQASKARKANVLICDTAGRLHTKKNLMDELSKMHKIIQREFPEANLETLLVIDATTGQNAISQAKVFNELTNVTGIVLTKLDGTAKGGVIALIKHELDIPIKFIGIGEKIDDLQPFDAAKFAEAMLG